MRLAAEGPFKLDLEWIEPQAFRWKECDEWLYGFVAGELIRVRPSGDGLDFECNGDEAALKDEVRHYFRLDEDVTPIHEALRQDAKIAELGLLKRFGGMRILRQDPWECLASFICTPRKRVERVTEILNEMAEKYGGEPHTLDGRTLHPFPTAARLGQVPDNKLEKLGLLPGRGRLIGELARDVVSGYLDFKQLRGRPYERVRGRLAGEYSGIGDKIADCVCLFSLGMDMAFPIDTHIERALKCHYDKKHTQNAPNAGLRKWIAETFGPNEGYASQLLFMHQWKKPKQ